MSAGRAGAPGPPRRRPGAGRWVLAGLLALPLVEIVVAVLVARAIGAGWTLGALLALTVAGLLVLRRTARAAVQALRPPVVGPDGAPGGGASSARGADLALETAGGVLLVLPGLVTGVLGLLLVLPPTRAVLRPLLGVTAARLVRSGLARSGRSGRVVSGEAVDVRVVRVEDLHGPDGPDAPPDRPDRPRPALPGEVVDPGDPRGPRPPGG